MHTSQHRIAGLAAMLISFLCTTSLYAQWSGDGTQQAEGSIPILTLPVVPELHTDMSWDCLIGYIAMDSIARTQQATDILHRVSTTSTDSLRVAARFAYAVSDYNPTLLRRYFYTTNRTTAMYPHAYPVNSYTGMRKQLSSKPDRIGRNYTMLVLSDYVYRIKVTDVVTGLDTLYTPHLQWVNIACRIEEVFKGQHWVGNCHTYYNQSVPSAIAGGATDPVGKCLIFGFPVNGRTGPIEPGDIQDTIYAGQYTTPQVDEEYIVFLNHIRLTDDEDVLIPLRSIEANGGLFKIANGKVADPSNIWQLGTTPSLSAFRQRLSDRIHDIKNWTAN